MNSADIVVVSLATGRHRTLTAGSGLSSEHPRYSPDGKHLVWHAFNLKRAFNDQGRLMLLRARPAVARGASPPGSTAATSHSTGRPDGAVAVHADRGSRPAGALAAGLERSDAGTGRGRAERSAASPCRATASASRSIGRALSHPAGAVRDRGRRPRRAAARVAQSRAVRRAPRSARRASSPSRAGVATPVQVWVTYPPNFDPKKKWPLLHSIHGGPHAAHTDGWHLPLEHAGLRRARLRRRRRQLSRLVGIRPAVAGNDHRPITVRREFADTEAATDFMLRQGYIDRNRLVATGGSYGGYMVAYMNGHTDRYRTYRLPRRLLRLGEHDGDRRLPVFRQGARRVPLGQSGAGDEAVAASLRQALQDADAGHPRRARLSRAGDAGAAVLQHAARQADVRRGWCTSPTRTTGS